MEQYQADLEWSTTASIADSVVPSPIGKDSQERDTIPVLNHLREVYGEMEGLIKSVHEERFRNLKERFKYLYGHNPAFFCRAPGRVNIIGEHIDYCGYGVLPAAIEQDFLIAYSENDRDEIVIHNIDKDQYPSEKLPTDPYQKVKPDNHWINYFICGYKAILAFDNPLKDMVTSPKGLKILIDSRVPLAAGLSSSSAFTVSAALVTLHANGLQPYINKKQLTELCIQAERNGGIACGGMDQTISIFAEKGHAKMIEFQPVLSAEDVSIPSSVVLVVANSLTPSPKLLTIGTRYNKRVVECRFALMILTIKSGLATNWADCPFKILQELQAALKYSFLEMITLTQDSLKKSNYTQRDLQQEFGIDNINEIIKDIPYSNDVLAFNPEFSLFKRATHVFNEAVRVHRFREVCTTAESFNAIVIGGKSFAETQLSFMTDELGYLMNESHISCRDLYECSSPELEELTTLCRQSGALGSRLTGAGWGGCCVSMVPKDIVNDFVGKIMDKYYNKQRGVGQQLWITDDLDRYIFSTQPARGACILDPKYCIWMM